jgi:hypothetical protein
MNNHTLPPATFALPRPRPAEDGGGGKETQPILLIQILVSFEIHV